MDVEEASLRAFIAPERRSRYLKLLGTPTGRKKLLHGFVHMKDLDPRFAYGVRVGHHDAVSIYDDLRRLGAPERCYVMSASNDLDGQETELLSALRETVYNEDGTLISCLPGRLAYFESEYGQYILARPA